MALNLPQQRKTIRQIQIERERVPIDQIISVKGKSMLSPIIEQTGNVIGQVLARRAENKRQGEILAGLERVSGQEAGSYSGLTPEVAQMMASAKLKNKWERDDSERKKAESLPKIRLLERQAGLADGSLGDDYDSAKVVFQNLMMSKRQQENPALESKGKSASNALRGQYIGQSKQFRDMSEGYQRIQDSSKVPTPAGDLAMLFNYMKMLDPTSVVRESEFAQAAATGSYGQRMQANVQRILNGKRLTDEQRNDFLFQAKQLYSGQEALQSQRDKEFERIAIESGIDPKPIVFNMRSIQTPSALQPLPVPGGGLSPDKKARLEYLRNKRNGGI